MEDKAMARYLVLWEVDESKIPLDPNVRRESWLQAIKMTREDMKSGSLKEYGAFLGQTKGFNIDEGTEEEIAKRIMKYIPLCRFQIIPLITLDQLEKAIESIK